MILPFVAKNVYRNTAAVMVDQRYDLTGFKPSAAILTDSGNENIHIAFMTAAGISTANYTTVGGQSLLSHCYTFASEPHNSNTGATTNAVISNIRTFVTQNGNFLAECAAVLNYENNSLGRFQTTTGITVSNTHVGTTVSFPNPDLSFSQFEGVFNGSLTGSVENWQTSGASANSENDHVIGLGANTSSISASVAKIQGRFIMLLFLKQVENFVYPVFLLLQFITGTSIQALYKHFNFLNEKMGEELKQKGLLFM